LTSANSISKGIRTRGREKHTAQSTGDSGLSSSSNTTDSALSGTNGAADNTSSAIEGACNTLADRLDSIELTLSANTIEETSGGSSNALKLTLGS